MKDHLIFNKRIVLNILSYFQSGVRNIGVFLSLSIVIFSFSLYFKNVNKHLLILLHLVSLILIIIVGVLTHFIHKDSINFRNDNDIFPENYQSYIAKWDKLIFGLKIVTFILITVFLFIFIFDIKNIYFQKKK